MVSEIRNLLKSKNIFLFKIIICFIISILINNCILYIAFAIYLFIDDKYNLYIYIAFLLLYFLFNYIKGDYIPIGIIEFHEDDYYLVDKLIYKTKLITRDNLQIGDIVLSYGYKCNNYENELKKNLLFYGYDYKVIGSIWIKRYIYTKINDFNPEYRSILLKLMYNHNDYSNKLLEVIKYSLLAYYLLRIFPNNRYLLVLMIALYSVIFGFQIKFIFIIIDKLFNLDRIKRFILKVIIISFININLLYNYSILIPILDGAFGIIDFKISFRAYQSIIFSFLFKQINIVYVFLYRYFIYLYLIIFCLSFISIFIPNLKDIVFYLLNLIDDLKLDSLSIRGSLNILSILILMFCFNKIKNHYIQEIFIYLLFLIPISYPYMSVNFIDVGQGDSILISDYFNMHNVLIDTGSIYNYYKIKNFLYSRSIYKIDYLIITHNDSDHNGNVESLKDDFSISKIVNTNEDVDIGRIHLKNYYIGDFDNDNDNSLVYTTSINDISFMFTGDISSIGEKMLINKFGNINLDVLKSSHHGSNSGNSEYFISNTLPSIAIISTSGMYNHPSNETIDTFDKYLVKYYITKNDKDICFLLCKFINLIKTGNHEFAIIKV